MCHVSILRFYNFTHKLFNFVGRHQALLLSKIKLGRTQYFSAPIGWGMGLSLDNRIKMFDKSRARTSAGLKYQNYLG